MNEIIKDLENTIMTLNNLGFTLEDKGKIIKHKNYPSCGIIDGKWYFGDSNKSWQERLAIDEYMGFLLFGYGLYVEGLEANEFSPEEIEVIKNFFKEVE